MLNQIHLIYYQYYIILGPFESTHTDNLNYNARLYTRLIHIYKILGKLRLYHPITINYYLGILYAPIMAVGRARL